jgi:hypothetical protein
MLTHAPPALTFQLYCENTLNIGDINGFGGDIA